MTTYHINDIFNQFRFGEKVDGKHLFQLNNIEKHLVFSFNCFYDYDKHKFHKIDKNNDNAYIVVVFNNGKKEKYIETSLNENDEITFKKDKLDPSQDNIEYIEYLAAALRETNNKVTNVDNKVKVINTNIEGIQGNINSIQSDLDQAEQHITESYMDLDNRSKENKQNIEKNKTEINSLKEQNSQHLSQLEELNNKIEAHKTNIDPIVSQNTIDISSAKSEINGLKSHIEENDSQIKNNKDNLSLLSTQVENNDKIVKDVKDTVDTINPVVENHKTIIADNTNKINTNTNNIAEHTEKISALEHKSSELSQKTQQNESNILSNTNAISQLTEKTNETQEIANGLKSQQDENTSNIATNKQEIGSLKTEVQAIHPKIENNTSHISKNTNDIRELQSAIEDHNNQLAGASDLFEKVYDDNIKIQSNIKDVKKEIKSNKDAITTAKESLAEVENTANTAKEKAESNYSQINTVKSQIETNTANIHKNEQAINTQTDKVSQLENTVSTFDSKITTNKEQIDQIKPKVDSNAAEISGVKSSIDNINTNIQSQNSEIAKLKKSSGEQNETITSNTSAIEGINSNISALQQQSQTNTANISRHEQMISSSQENIQSIESIANTAKNTVDELKPTVLKNKEDILNNASLLSTQNGKIEKNKTDIETINSNLSDLNDKILTVESDKENIEKKIKANTDNITTLTSKIDQNTNTIAELNSSIDTNTQNITNNTANIDKNKKELTSVKGSISTLEGTISTHGTDISGLKAKDSTLEESISNVDSKATNNTSEINKNKESIQSINTTVTNHTGRIDQVETTTRRLDSSLSENISKTTKNTEDITSVNEKISEHTASLTSQGETIASNTEKITALESSVGTQNDNITELQNKSSQFESQIGSHTSSIDSINQNIESIESKNTEQDASILEAKTSADTATQKVGQLSNLVEGHDYNLIESYDITPTLENKGNAFERESTNMGGWATFTSSSFANKTINAVKFKTENGSVNRKPSTEYTASFIINTNCDLFGSDCYLKLSINDQLITISRDNILEEKETTDVYKPESQSMEYKVKCTFTPTDNFIFPNISAQTARKLKSEYNAYAHISFKNFQIVEGNEPKRWGRVDSFDDRLNNIHNSIEGINTSVENATNKADQAQESVSVFNQKFEDLNTLLKTPNLIPNPEPMITLSDYPRTQDSQNIDGWGKLDNRVNNKEITPKILQFFHADKGTKYTQQVEIKTDGTLNSLTWSFYTTANMAHNEVPGIIHEIESGHYIVYGSWIASQNGDVRVMDIKNIDFAGEWIQFRNPKVEEGEYTYYYLTGENTVENIKDAQNNIKHIQTDIRDLMIEGKPNLIGNKFPMVQLRCYPNNNKSSLENGWQKFVDTCGSQEVLPVSDIMYQVNKDQQYTQQIKVKTDGTLSELKFTFFINNTHHDVNATIVNNNDGTYLAYASYTPTESNNLRCCNIKTLTVDGGTYVAFKDIKLEKGEYSKYVENTAEINNQIQLVGDKISGLEDNSQYLLKEIRKAVPDGNPNLFKSVDNLQDTTYWTTKGGGITVNATEVTITNAWAGLSYKIEKLDEIKSNRFYTYSFDVYISNSTQFPEDAQLNLYADNYFDTGIKIINFNEIPKNQWTRLSISIKCTGSGSKTGQLRVESNKTMNQGEFKLRNFKFERGKEPTPFDKNGQDGGYLIKDLQSKIKSNTTEINNLKQQISSGNSNSDLTSKVDTNTRNISSLTSRMNTTESNVSQLTSRMTTAESDISRLKSQVGNGGSSSGGGSSLPTEISNKIKIETDSYYGQTKMNFINNREYHFCYGSAYSTDNDISMFWDNRDGMSLRIPSAYRRTTSSPANLNVNVQGYLTKVSSARKYKDDIKYLDDLNHAKKILNINPASWYDKEEERRIAEGEEKTLNRYYGFIADDFDDQGLEEVIIRDSEGEVDSLAYDRISIYLLQLIKDLYKENDSLKEEIKQLKEAIK